MIFFVLFSFLVLLENEPIFQSYVLICIAFGKAFSAAGYATLYVYTVEVYPTPLRSIGLGCTSMFARIAALVQPQCELLAEKWPAAPFFIYGIISIIGGLSSIYFPETRDRKFPETVEEAENFRKNAALDGKVVVVNINPNWRKSRIGRANTRNKESRSSSLTSTQVQSESTDSITSRF